jgi:hypothetical protein
MVWVLSIHITGELAVEIDGSFLLACGDSKTPSRTIKRLDYARRVDAGLATKRTYHEIVSRSLVLIVHRIIELHCSITLLWKGRRTKPKFEML